MAESGFFDRFRAKPTVPKEREIGRTGTVNTQGFITDEELNAKLRWPSNLTIYDQMRRTDSGVRWMLALVKTPIRSATWTVEPASESDQDREVAAFVEHCLFNHIEGGWDEFLRQALFYLDYGHMVFETLAAAGSVTFDVSDRDNEEKVTKSKDAIVIRRLAPRMPSTIQKWIPKGKNPSELAAIEQQLFDGTGAIRISADRLIIFTNEKEGDDWRGVSLLRSAYKNWRFKNELENMEAIAYERSTGLPVVYPPDNARQDEVDKMEEALQSIRQGDALYIVMPGPKAGTTDDKNGWVLEDHAIKGDAWGSPDVAIRRHDTNLARNVLAEFMLLGQGGTGARATADVQQDPYYGAVEATVGYMEGVLNEKLVAPLVGWNYDVDHPPKLKASKIHAKAIESTATMVSTLAQQDLIVPDDRLEAWLRELTDAPPIDHKSKEARAEAARPTPNPITEGQVPKPGTANKKSTADTGAKPVKTGPTPPRKPHD
jgi:hypothetical protein